MVHAKKIVIYEMQVALESMIYDQKLKGSEKHDLELVYILWYDIKK